MHTPLLPRHPRQVMPMMGFKLDYCFFNHVKKKNARICQFLMLGCQIKKRYD